MKNKVIFIAAILLISLNVKLSAQMKRHIQNMNPTGRGITHSNKLSPNNLTSCLVDTITLTTQAQINNFSTNYPTCTTPKYLIIDGEGASPAITSLAGLSSITQVINKLEIRNTSLTSLSQLTGLTQIGDTLLLERNNALASIGLNNLTQLGAIYFSHLPALTSVAGLCNNFHTTGLIYIDSTNLSNLSGLHTLDSLTTGNGGVMISNCPIVNASALNNLRHMEGYLRFSTNSLQTSIGLTNIRYFWGFLFDGMPLLNSVAGLSGNLTSGNIGTFWFFNTGISSLAGLEGITGSSNFYISGNNSLTNLNGLQNLSGNIGGGISMYGNSVLSNISALSGITNIDDGTIEIAYNNDLASLNGLQNITNIGKGLWLYGNSSLTTLSNLNNNLVIQNNTDSYSGNKDSVRIFENQLLELCSDTSICNYLSGGGTAEVYNNAPGCNTVAEIQSTCGSGINYNDPEDNCCTYNAIPVNQNITRNGNVGHYIGVDGNGDPEYDEADVYRIILPYDGAFNLFFTAKNDSSCHDGTQPTLSAEILDEYGNYLQYSNLFNWSNADPCDMLKTDSFKFRGYAADTVFVRLTGDRVSYSFYWQALDSTSGEPEPNDDIVTAATMTPLQIKKGHIKFKTANHYDQNDYYKTVLPVSANIDVYLKITSRENTIPSPSNRLHIAWGYTAPIGYFTNSNYVALPNADEIIYDTIHICGLANDTMYFRLTAPQEAYEYELSYKIKDTLPNDAFEPNNTFITSTPIAAGQTRQSTVNYIGKAAKDGEDNFMTVIPQTGTMKIYVKATSSTCDAGYLNLAGLNKQQSYVFTRYISGNTSIPTQTTVYDTISLCGQPTDTFYFKFIASVPFAYEFRYDMVDTIPDVPEGTEPNNNFATATPVNELDSVKGRIRFITLPLPDDNDYFRTVLPKDGTMNLILKTTNYSCGNNYVNLWIYDRTQAPGTVSFSQLSSDNGKTRYDTIKLCGLASDTFYIRLQSFGKFIYAFKYQLTDTSINDVEPNNSFATATLHNENEIKKGHVQYRSNIFDSYDYYKTVLPKDGTLKLIVQATNRSCANGQYTYLRAYDGQYNQIYANYLANNGSVAAGQTVYDTISFCGRAVDTFYLRFEATTAFTYQYSYEVTDTGTNDIEPNNSFAQSTNIAENEIKKGHIRYNSNGTTDVYDHYKTVLPKDGTIKVMVQATNRSCANGQYVYLRAYDGQYGQIYNNFIANNGSVAAGQTVYDTILLCGRAVDTFFLRFEASAAFTYLVSYKMVDTSANDIEPNNSFAEATGVGSSQIKKGHIRYNSNGVTDNYDYYKFIFTTSDSLKLQLQATNRSCANGQYVYLRMYNKNFGQIYNNFLSNNGSVAAGQTIYDSIKMYVTAPDTIYLRYEASAAFSYQLSTNERLPSVPNIIGDSTTCFGLKTYKAVNVVDDNVVYHWSLSGGGTLNFTDSIATVNWNTNGTYILSLYLSNSFGNSPTRTKTIIINNNAPTETPVLNNFARTLSTNNLPSGTVCKWYRNGVEIIGITDSSYYAADSGTYTVKFVRPCGTGPVSNSIYFPLPAQAQIITFVHTPDIIMSPTAKAKLNATASSGLPISFQLISGNASVIADSVYALSVGQIIIRAQQQGDNVYSAATYKYDTINVVQGPQSIVFNQPADTIFPSAPIAMNAIATSGLGITYTVISGNGYISGNTVVLTGAGTITVQAVQNGNANYSAAVPVQRTFCVGLRTLGNITGEPSPCLNTYNYYAQKIPGASYVWTLSSGGTLVPHNDTAIVSWTTPGSHTITVKANTACDPIYSSIVSYGIVTSNNAPVTVTNMLPADGAINQQLPLTLSWQPGLFTVNYDLYVWDSAVAQPGVPFASNISTVNYTLPQNSLQYNKTYKWRVVSKNPCLFTTGPVQKFRLIPLPDLQVLNVQAPLTAFSGQTVTFNWTIKNNGPGKTQTGLNWSDAVYLSFDSIPNFSAPPQTNPAAWNFLEFPIRPLLVGTRQNISALDSGQQYNNSINFTLPVNYDQPLYIYVITNNPRDNNLLQTTVANDTARAPQPINVTLSPTPDLRVDTIFTPASTFSGNTINVTYKVKNYGVVTPPNTSWTDKFYISPTANFNPANAVPLKSPKPNDTYYYYAIDAATGNNTQLNADSSYTKVTPVVIPNYIFGTYFIHVITDANNTVYEGALDNNNTNSRQLQVYLTPTPQLVINNFSAMDTAYSTTQPASVVYTEKNTGFWDNIEKNQGHHIVPTTACTYQTCSYTYDANGNVVGYSCTTHNGFNYRDSTSWGASFWMDKIYISSDSSNTLPANSILLNTVWHGLPRNGTNYESLASSSSWVYNNACIEGPAVPVIGSFNIGNVIKPQTDFPVNRSLPLPGYLQPGKYYIYVQSNAGSNADSIVYEYPVQPVKRSTGFNVRRPDLIPPVVNIPSAVTADVPFTIIYTISNGGPGNVYNQPRKDLIYVSTSAVFDASAQLISTQTFNENILVGTPVQHSLSYTFPAATPTGARYFYVHTNYDSAFRETNMNNNRSTAALINVTISPAKDLITSNVQVNSNPSDTIFTTNTVLPFKYTVTNNGSGTITGKIWTDSIFVSCSPTFNANTAFYLAKRTHNDVLAPGVGYVDSLGIVIPKFSYELNGCFAADNTPAYIFVISNADNGVYEGSNRANNIAATVQKKMVNPYIDLIVTNVNGLDSATVARYYTTSWTVKNNKYYTPYGYSGYNHTDRIFFSPDSVLNVNAINTDSRYEGRLLGSGQTYNSTNTYILPNMPAGDYYVHVNANGYNQLPAEKSINNNSNLIRNASGAAKKIHVSVPLLPDLKDSILSAPSNFPLGQYSDITYSVSNSGAGDIFPYALRTAVYLSSDFIPGNGDLLLGYEDRNGPLVSGQSYNYTLSNAYIPASVTPGNYILIVVTDRDDRIVESNETNNLSFQYVTVFAPPPVDLYVQNVSHPDTVILGNTLDSAKWVINNNSGNTAAGVTTDGIYLSANGVLDSASVLIGVKNRTMNMLPLSNDLLNATPVINKVIEGNYKLIVRADIQNNIIETNENNNITAASGNLYVKATELPMNVLMPNTLALLSRYYKLVIPDSLNGSTILVTLKSTDSLTSNNQMYIGKGYVPNAGNFDYKYDKPNYGNQDIVMDAVTAGTYYIAITKMSSTVITQNITLKAKKLPFEILNVHTNSGGNTGNVTIKISGSLFNNNMRARIYNGSTSIVASALYFTSSTVVYATFNLQAKPLGIYNVELYKLNDSTTATLVNGFSIVNPNNGGLITGGGVNTGPGNGNDPGCDPGAASGLNSQLVTEMVLPDKIFGGWIFVIQINYNNPTNVDIPAQTRVLYCTDGFPVSLTQAGIGTATSSLYLELTEPGGPPGIIRAGGSGTIKVYSKAPVSFPAHNYANYILK